MAKKFNLRVEGVVTALSPIYHGSGTKDGKKEKTLDEVIKWKIISEDGLSSQNIPVLNGNMIRGILRDCGASMIAEKVGGFKRLSDFRVYWLGGTAKTTEEGGVDPGDLQKEAQLRKNNPFISLFGGQIKSILSGHLRVGAMVPICDTTKHLIPDYFMQEGVGVFHEDNEGIIDKGILTRRDDAKSPEKAVYLLDEAAIERDDEIKKMLEKKAKKKSGEEENGDDEKKKSADMIRRFETMPAGAKMYHYIDIFNATEEEIGLLVECLRRFSYNPYVGGRSSIGYGQISIYYHLIHDGKKEDFAIKINQNEGFVLNNKFLNECSSKFNLWLEKLDSKSVSVF